MNKAKLNLNVLIRVWMAACFRKSQCKDAHGSVTEKEISVEGIPPKLSPKTRQNT